MAERQGSDPAEKQIRLDYATPPREPVKWYNTKVPNGLLIGLISLFAVAFWMVVPMSCGADRERAHRVMCGSNLRQIGQGLMLYAQDHADQFPPTLDLLILHADVRAEVFICPSTTHINAAGSTAEEQAANFAADQSRCSYVYLPTTRPFSQIDPYEVIAYEKPGNHDDAGMNVLYGDGHVEWFSKRQADHVLSELKQGHNPPRPRQR